jgi:RHS repeat-associated protein
MKTACIPTVATAMAMGLCTGLQASVTEHQPPAPLPEFKTPEQLAKWRSDIAARTANQESTSSRPSTLDSSTPFYTGKPYLAESGSYAFKYREYNPEMGRWTTVDPSGFPDGANNRLYAAVPTSEFDSNGLWRSGKSYVIGTHSSFTDRAAADLAPAYFGSKNPLSKRAVEHLIDGTDSTISDIIVDATEQATIQADSEWSKLVNYVDARLKKNKGGATTFTAASDSVDVAFATGDLATAIHKASFTITGTITPTWNSSQSWWDYDGELTVAFTDPYDFALGSGYKVDCFAQLQAHDWSSAFNIKGNWNAKFPGHFE